MLIDENDKLEYKEKVSNSLPKEIVINWRKQKE